MTNGPTGAGETLYIFTLFGIIALQIIVLIGVLMATYIYSAVRFYKTMYSKQGYLTHTLPVNYHQLVLGKLLTNSAWIFIITIAVVIAEVIYFMFIFNWVFSSLALVGDTSLLGSHSSIWSLIGDNWSTIVSEIQMEIGINIGSFLWIVLVMLIIAAPSSMMMIFGAITIGQLSSKHKVAMSILSYFAINIVFSFLSNIMSIISMANFSYRAAIDGGAFLTQQFIPIIVLNILVAVGLYFISMVIVQKKLNLE
jgi:hypothetical protein